MIYYLIGQPGSGKSTLSTTFDLMRSDGKTRDIDESYEKLIQIDGDVLRKIFTNLDYSKKGRHKNIRRAHDIALFMSGMGYDVAISMVSPYRELREELKSKTKVIEIYLHTTEDRGKSKFQVDDFEPPIENYIDIDTTGDTILESWGKIYNEIKKLSNIY